jgi:tetratricopeptide (TPR) repeat protein/transglutaminase-like putative cysteine protease
MSAAAFLKARLALALLFSVPSLAQSPVKKDEASQDFAKEGVVIEQLATRVAFRSDGTSTTDFRARIRIRTDGGVRQYGVLTFPYQASVGSVEVQNVRVTKPNGSVIATPLDSIQDMTSEVSRDAPMYSDLREKHVPVKGLEPGDTLEYSARWLIEKPLATGQFWYSYQFIKSSIVLDEQLEISVPHEREVKLRSQTIRPTTREENGLRIYTWKTSNLNSVSGEEQKKAQSYDAIRGLLPPPDVLISSFRTWEEVGQWYDSLQQEKIQTSPEVKAKAEELTKGLSDDDAKLHAIYNYVSLRYRYVAISFGIGRYQPHSAPEILGNQYGDCKDKHTLLAALLNVVGIRAYPVLISAQTAVDENVPSPGQFNHVISVVAKGNTLSWMDTTPEVTAMGYLMYPLRGKPALVILPDKVAFQTTPADPPFANAQTDTITAKLEADGTLHAHVEALHRGDNELYFRHAFRRWPESQWKDLGQQIAYGARLGGTISNVKASSPERTEEPFSEAYDYSLKDFSEGDKHRFVVPLPPMGIPEVKDEDLNRKTPLWLGYAGELQYESRVELPKGWSVTPPAPIDLKESFADYHAASEVQEGILITKRRLLLKASDVTPDQLTRYKIFQKVISDDHNTYTFLRVSADVAATGPAVSPSEGVEWAGDLIRQSLRQLPGSSNLEALQAEQDAQKSIRTKDYTSATTALKHAVALDPTFSRAWIQLGAIYYWGTGEMSSSLNAFQRAIDADPKQIVPYKILAFTYIGLGRPDDANATWQRLRIIAPADRDLALNFSISTSKAASQLGSKGFSDTRLVSSVNPSTLGEAVTFTAIVVPQFSGTPTGEVTFKNGAQMLGSASISHGNATYTTTQLAVGTDSITAVYSGSSSFFPSTSNALSQAVNSASTLSAQGPARAGELVRQSRTQLPGSSNSEALQAEENARKSTQTKDYTSAITALKYAVSLDANFSRAWIELGWVYAASKDKSSALNAFQKAVDADPKQVVPYKMLALMYMDLADRDNAIATWQKLQSISPGDRDLALYLGTIYLEQKRYSDAASLFESVAKASPTDAFAQMSLGIARLRSHNTDQGLDALRKALEIDSGAEMLNNVAYEMAGAGTNLPDALSYSQRSVKEVEERSQKVDLENIQKADLLLPLTIYQYWDTLGWIYFKMGDLARAEIYLNSAWQLGQDGVVGDHLGQVYEKEQKLPAALHTYKLALEAYPRLEETPERIRKLTASAPVPANGMGSGEELKLMRTAKLPAIIKETASADFDVLLVASGKITKANFLRGSELLRLAGESLEKALFEEPFPPNSTARLVRRGALSCSDTGCSFVFYPPSDAVAAAIPPSDNPQAGQVPRQCGFSTPETQLKVSLGKVSQGNLVHRVEPEYPPAARQGHIHGTVVLCGTIAKDGALRNLRAFSGPEELIPSAMRAVEQWRYQPYLLNNEPVDVDSEIHVDFTLSR